MLFNFAIATPEISLTYKPSCIYIPMYNSQHVWKDQFTSKQICFHSAWKAFSWNYWRVFLRKNLNLSKNILGFWKNVLDELNYQFMNLHIWAFGVTLRTYPQINSKFYKKEPLSFGLSTFDALPIYVLPVLSKFFHK